MDAIIHTQNPEQYYRGPNLDMVNRCKDSHGFNDLPPGWHKLTEAGVAKSHFSAYSPLFREYIQAVDPDTGKREAYHLYWFHDGSGIAMSFDYWGGIISWFGFQVCEHENETISASMCYREYRCKKCGYRHAVDSSG